jgi:hypothetical protein
MVLPSIVLAWPPFAAVDRADCIKRKAHPTAARRTRVDFKGRVAARLWLALARDGPLGALRGRFGSAGAGCLLARPSQSCQLVAPMATARLPLPTTADRPGASGVWSPPMTDDEHEQQRCRDLQLWSIAQNEIRAEQLARDL